MCTLYSRANGNADHYPGPSFHTSFGNHGVGNLHCQASGYPPCQTSFSNPGASYWLPALIAAMHLVVQYWGWQEAACSIIRLMYDSSSSTSWPTNQLTEWPTEQRADQATDQLTETPSSRPPTDKPTRWPADQLSKRPTNRPLPDCLLPSPP